MHRSLWILSNVFCYMETIHFIYIIHVYACMRYSVDLSQLSTVQLFEITRQLVVGNHIIPPTATFLLMQQSAWEYTTAIMERAFILILLTIARCPKSHREITQQVNATSIAFQWFSKFQNHRNLQLVSCLLISHGRKYSLCPLICPSDLFVAELLSLNAKLLCGKQIWNPVNLQSGNWQQRCTINCSKLTV